MFAHVWMPRQRRAGGAASDADMPQPDFQYNGSRVTLPDGYARFEIKRLVLHRPDLDANCRALLGYVLDQAPAYVFTIAGIRARLSWGEHRWVTTREKLVSRAILTQSRTILPSGSSRWQLDFDFIPLIPARAPGDDARTHEPPKPGDHDLPESMDQERPPETRGSEFNNTHSGGRVEGHF